MLKIKKRQEGNHYFYYITLLTESVARTHSMEDVPCMGTSGRELVQVDIKELPEFIQLQFVELAKTFDQIQVVSGGFKLILSSHEPSNTTSCMVNIDLDVFDRVVGIEIV